MAGSAEFSDNVECTRLGVLLRDEDGLDCTCSCCLAKVAICIASVL